MEPQKDDIEGLVTLMTNAAAVDESEDSWAHRRARFKAKPMDYQQKRRVEALEQQKSKRLDRTILARKLVSSVKPPAKDLNSSIPYKDVKDVEMAENGTSSSSAARPTTFENRQKKLYADQLQLPEPLVEIPPDFIQNWLCVPRPIGHRCLVIGTQGRTYARHIDGTLFLSFDSILPGGCPTTGTKSDHFCILDCIYSEAQLTFYIVDVLCWNARIFYDLEAAGRQIWAKSRVQEDGPFDIISKDQTRKFVVLPHLDANLEEITALSNDAGAGKLPFSVSSLYFYHKEGIYEHGMTPLMFELDIQQFQAFMGALQRHSNNGPIS